MSATALAYAEQILLSMSLIVLNAALVWTVAPPRLGIFTQLVPGVGATKPYLHIAIQSCSRETTSDGLTLSVKAKNLGGIEATRPLVAYCGTPEDKRQITAQLGIGPDASLEIRIAELRALKTLVFKVPLLDPTDVVVGTLSGKRRRLGELAPWLEWISENAASYHPGDFSFPWSAYLENRTSGAQQGDATLIRPSWGRRFEMRDGRVLGTTLALVTAGYVTLLSFTGGSEAGSLMSRLAGEDALLDLACLAGALLLTTILFFLVRPSWPIVAQGYLVEQTIDIASSAGK